MPRIIACALVGITWLWNTLLDTLYSYSIAGVLWAIQMLPELSMVIASIDVAPGGRGYTSIVGVLCAVAVGNPATRNNASAASNISNNAFESI
jgi:hypothetical protein